MMISVHGAVHRTQHKSDICPRAYNLTFNKGQKIEMIEAGGAQSTIGLHLLLFINSDLLGPRYNQAQNVLLWRRTWEKWAFLPMLPHPQGCSDYFTMGHPCDRQPTRRGSKEVAASRVGWANISAHLPPCPNTIATSDCLQTCGPLGSNPKVAVV